MEDVCTVTTCIAELLQYMEHVCTVTICITELLQYMVC